jgi:hypothetical protein
MMSNRERYATFTNIDQLKGMDWMCRLLLTSPRMHKPQVEIIEDALGAVRRRIEEIAAGPLASSCTYPFCKCDKAALASCHEAAKPDERSAAQ